MRFFIFLFIILASYGSLYPFDFQYNAHSINSFYDTLWTTSKHQSISDIFGNIALFLPYGIIIAIKNLPKQHISSIIYFLCGLVLATILQILQLYTPSRDPNIQDIFWNMAGTGFGFLIGKFLIRAPNPENLIPVTLSIEWLLIGSWISFQLLPFVPTLDLGLIWSNLKQFRPPFHLSISSFLSQITGWLMAGFLLKKTLPKFNNSIFALVIFITLLIKLFLVDTTIEPSAYIAGLISVIIWQIGLSKSPNYKTVLLILLLTTILINGIFPLKILPNPQAFNWIPFYGFLTGSMLINTQNLLEKLFLYGGLIWIFPKQNKHIIIIALILLTSGIEFFQIYLSHHTAEITDPILILILALAIKYAPDSEQKSHNFSHKAIKSTTAKPVQQAFTQPPPRLSYSLIVLVCLITLGLKLFLSFPQLPYNIKELFLDNGSWFRVLFFSFFLIWFGISGPLISKLCTFFQINTLYLLPITILVCAVSFFLIKFSVSYESLSDILGSITIRKSIENDQLWGNTGQFLLIFPNAIDKIERYVRFIALIAPLTASMSYWVTFFTIAKSTFQSGIILFKQTAVLAVIFIISKLIVIDYAGTDNLTELIAKNGLFFLAALILLITANTTYLFSKPLKFQIKKVSTYLFTVTGVIAGWYFLNLGLAENLHKYGLTFSGIDFLLGPNRKTHLDTSVLFGRWCVLYLSLMFVLGLGIQLANLISIDFRTKQTVILNKGWITKIVSNRFGKLTLNHTHVITGIVITSIVIIGIFYILPKNTFSSTDNEKPKLLEADKLPAANIAFFQLQHPRLPAPKLWEIRQIKRYNPSYIQTAQLLGNQGKGKLYQAILTATIKPDPVALNNLYNQLTTMQFEGRGNVQAKPLALAYDWLYPYWSSEQKRSLQEKLTEGCQYLIEFIREQRLSPYNVFLYNSPFQALMATAIVLYKDHPYGQTCMNFTDDLWKNRVLPVWRQVMGDNGGWHEGGEYIGIGIGQAIYQVPAMWRKATGEDLFRTEPGIRGFLDFLIYRTRPDGTHMRWGDARFFDKAIPDRIALAIEYNDKAAYSLNKCPPPYKPSASPWGPLTTDQLCDTQAKYRLPLEKHFDGIGMVIARSSWNADATYVTFKAGNNFWSHSHLDQGSFTLFKGGPLVIDSGLYGPKYGSDHHMNYSYQTIAHNVITVTDYQDNVPAPEKKKKPPRPIANDGGQRRVGSGWGVESAPLDLNEWLTKKDIYHTGKIEKYYTDENVVVAIANLTPAYTNKNSGSGAFSARSRRVEDYWRTFIYDKKLDIVIVYDNITATKETYTKRSIFHTINRPYLSNNKIISHVFSRKNPSQTDSTLEATVLFPKGAYINIIGGKGAEFLVQNKNYDENGQLWNSIKNRQTNPPEPGSWRVEIIPPLAQKTDQFLTVYNPKLLGSNKEIIITPIENKTQIGCRINGISKIHSFLFSKATHNLTIEWNNGTKQKTIELSLADL